ncbi:MAG: phosphoribosylformylglycinamidine synthase, partial [Deltaproteobacteria bacterium]|nr:phosphoribosylformylglycinamidine synthase [Deltaproteobacteria bacterium]
MIHRIEVGFRQGIRDVLGEKTRQKIVEHLGIDVTEAKTIDVYTLEGNIAVDELTAVASGPLSDPIIQEYVIDRGLAAGFDWLIEVGFRPGVTDNVGKTAREAIELLLGRQGAVDVYTSRQYALKGDLGRSDAERIASGLLANELIQHYEIIGTEEWNPAQGAHPYIPRVIIKDDPTTEEIDLDVTDEELRNISNTRVLALTVDEMKIIRDHLLCEAVLSGRREAGLGEQATDVEVECLAQTWSEHCKHKIFNSLITYEDEAGDLTTVDSLYSSCIKKATKEIRAALGEDDWCLSVFVDNAGIIRFNDDYNLVFKVETHNSPSALDPYGGALTGIVGVNRDPFGTGKGSKLIFNTDVFCFASPFYDKPLPPRILHPRRIYDGVREGVEHGGNKS